MWMTTRHLVDKDLLAALDALPGSEMNDETLLATRASLLKMVESAPIVEGDGIRVTEISVPGPANARDVRVLFYQPENRKGLLPAFLHMHGGGYVVGMPERDDARNRLLVRSCGCVVVSVDYRLAPETPFPGGVEDCYAVLEWLYRNADEHGVDPRRIAIGGESAGGGMAAALALLARDRKEIPVAFQMLIYPMIDNRTSTDGDDGMLAGEFVWTQASNDYAWRALLGDAHKGSDASPYAAAARATDLSGLPATFIAVGTLDLFVDEDIEYARRLIRAGVPTELKVYPGAYHGFEDLAPDAAISRAFVLDYFNALQRALKQGECAAGNSPSD
jgi:acetyl esterase/lipase